MMSGNSGNPLYKKLGYKVGQVACSINEPKEYKLWISGAPFDVIFSDLSEVNYADLIHIFCSSESDLHNMLPLAKSKLDVNGSIWVSWIKKASKNYEWSITDMVVRDFGLSIGLVDVKVCAVSDDWSGLKFMFRKEDRKRIQQERM